MAPPLVVFNAVRNGDLGTIQCCDIFATADGKIRDGITELDETWPFSGNVETKRGEY